MQAPLTVYLCNSSGEQHSAELLKTAAADYTGQDTSLWTRRQTPHGKPYVVEAPQLHFSVSHSGAYWACAFGKAPLGLDIQLHKPALFEQLARRFFCKEEVEYLSSQSYAPAAFYRIWTAKESCLKRLGSGFPAKLPSLNVLAPLPDGSVLQYLAAPDGYTMCLCTETPEAASVVTL